MNDLRLYLCHTRYAISPFSLAFGRDGWVTSYTHPQYRYIGQRRTPPIAGVNTTDEDVIDNDPRPGAHHSGDTLHPCRFQFPEYRPWTNRAINAEFDTRIRSEERLRHCVNERIDPETQPW